MSQVHDESRFFENMTIHKQYQEYVKIKGDSYKKLNRVNRWSTIYLTAGILYGLILFLMLFTANTR